MLNKEQMMITKFLKTKWHITPFAIHTHVAAYETPEANTQGCPALPAIIIPGYKIDPEDF